MMKKVNVKMAVLSLLMALVMLMGVVFSASIMTTASAATIPTLPETEYVSPTSPTVPTPYDGVPVTPGKINSSNYRTYGLTDENWQQYNGYYAIRNSKELYGFAALTRAQSTVNLSAVLLADIVINTSVSTSTGATYQWDPLVHEDIGDVYKNGFSGTFDGNGYSISGIYMESSGNLKGIFGSIAGSGVVKNLVLKNSVFKNHANGSAVFAHRDYGMIISCRVESSVIMKRTGKSSAGVSGIAWVAKTTQTVGSKRQTFTGGIENCFSNVTMDVYRAEDSESLNENGVIATELESVSKVNNNYGIVSNGYSLIGDKNYDSAGKWTTLKTQNDEHTCIPITHNQVNGTCYSSGLSAYTFCAVCEKILSGEKKVLYGHSTTETFCTLNKSDNSKHDKRCMECTEILGTEKHTYNSNVDIACKDCAFTFLTLNEAGTEYTLNQTSFTISHDLILSKPLNIPVGCTLTVAEGVTLTLQEQLTNNGSLINNGATVVKDGFMQGTGSVICGENATHHPAFNDDGFCAFCGDEEYPEAAPLVDGYYQVGNVGQLMWFSNFVGQGNGSANAKLTADIIYNASDLSGLNGKTEGYRFWTPIGMIMNHETGIDTFVTYTGTFDGDGHTVSGLYHFDYWSYAGNAGLVSKLGAGGVIKNVTVKNSYFATSSYAGAILGQNLGGVVENCHNVNTTVASAARVGGIVGDNRTGTIRYCTNKGNVKFFKVNSGLAFGFSEFGGIAGSTEGTIEYCTNYGDIVSSTEISGVGGIAGQIYQGTVKNCVNEGDINVSGGTNFGGITGYQYHGTLSYNINYGSVVGGNLAGGIIGNPFGNGGRYTHNYTVGGDACGMGSKNGCFAITEAELANGRLAFELGIGQELGKDARPSVGASAVYAYFNESGVVNYTNDANYTCHHKGGTATCDARAVCDGCRNPYGEIPEGAHKFEITGREDKPYCTVCGGRCGEVAPHNTNYIDYCAICGDWIPPVLAEDGFYEIKSFGNLMWFAEQVNAGNYDLNARLISNISYGATFRTTKWTPIAGSSISDTTVGYRGIFDGQGYSIPLFPQTELLTPEYDGAVLGLFGTLADGAVVKNLSISNRVEITFNNGGPNYTYDGDYTVYFGLIAGRVLEGATVSGCRVANGTVSISKGVLGAIVGVNYGTVENCVSYNMTLSGPAGRVGGIVGDYNGGELINCYTTYASLGSVASGYVGTAIDSEAGVSNERIASGEIAYTMNTYIGNPSFWYQTVGNGGPVGRSEYNVVGKIVYLHNLGDIVFYSNNEFKVVIKSDYTIPAGKTFLLPSGTTLEIAQNVTLTNEGTFIANGVLTGKGALAGNGAFQITDLDAEDITIPADFTFDGTEHYDAVVEGLESKLVIMGKTFSVEGYTRTFDFTSVKNAGEYTVTYTAEHETLTYSFHVKVLAVLDSDVSLDATILDYNGRAHEPSVVLAGIEVELGRDYYVTYSDNVSAGEVSVTITFRGNLSGEFTRSFTILPVAIGEKVSVEYATEVLFTGLELNPIAVSIGGVQLVRDVDYTVTFENNVYPGTATAKVVGIGSVSGEMDISFEILKPVFTVTVFDQNLPYNEDSNIKPFDQTMYEGEGLVEGHTVVLGESGGAGEMITILQILDANGVDVLEYYDLTVEMGKYHMFSERYRQEGGGYHWRDCVYNCDEKMDYEEHHGGIVTCSENGRCVDCGITYLWATGEHTYENGICTGCDYNPEYVIVLDQDGNGQHSGTEEGLRADSIHNIFSLPDLQYVVVKDFECVFAGVGQENTTIVLDLFGHTIDMTNAPYGLVMQANNLVVIFKSTSQESGTLIGETIVAYESVAFTLDNVHHEGVLDNRGTIYVQNGAVLYSEITNYGIIYLPEGYDLSTIVSYKGNGTLYVGDMALVYNEESGKLECADHIWGDADCITAKTCSRCGATDGDPLGHDTDGPATCEEDEYCTRCDSVITEKFGHTPKTVSAQEPTCTDVGYSESTVCANCDYVYVSAEEIPALGHTNADPVIKNVVEAVCGISGSYETVVYCSVCEDEISRELEIIPALEHNEVESVYEKSEASCTVDGYVIYIYTCTLCGDVRYSEQITLAADGHNAGEAQIVEQAAPNCKNDGFIKSVVQCAVCGEILETDTQTIPAQGHTPDIEAPTCTQAQYCTVCLELIQANVPHNYEDTVIEADCYLAGGINHVCKDCNTGYFEATQEALGHNPDKEAPTCTEDVICTRCNEILEVAIGHTNVWATCTTPHYCSTCQEEFNPANGHSFNADDVPDCTRDKYCVVCQYVEAEALGHNPDREAPTCTEHVCCTRCPAVLELATDHTYNNENGATCTEDYYCITCGEIFAESLGHFPTYSTAHCENENLCIRCGELLEAAVGHDYQSEVFAEPDCYRDGEIYHACTRCGDSYTEIQPQLEHDPVLQEGRPSTCTQQGYIGATVCSLCGTVLAPQASLPLGDHIDQNADGACDACGFSEECIHAWSEGVINPLPTCTESGVKTFTCSVCGETKTESVDAEGHNHQATVTAPTCTEQGYTTHKCHCGDSYVTDKTDALGHTEETVFGKAATCTEAGLTDGKKCSVCGEMSVEQSSIPALGHSYSEATCIAKATCSVCQDVRGEFAEHADGNGDGKCDACEYQMMPTIPEETTPVVPEETTPSIPEETTPVVPEETTPEQPEEEPKEGLSNGEIAGVVAGSTAAVGAGGFSLFWFVIKKKRFSDLFKITTKK